MVDPTICAGAQERALVADLVAAVLQDAAPEEVEVFRQDRDGFLDGRSPHQEHRDEELGFGVEVVALLTPFVVAAAQAAVRLIADAFATSLQEEAQSTFSHWLRRILHRGSGDATGVRDDNPASLTPELVKRVRSAAYEVCCRMGADQGDADLVADAVAGRFVVGGTG
ncbi:hypothetical protein ACFWFZ_03170 [Streptomyces sp. NPDC060232]|uniref:hypothetical protein n=1 Tax=Streptomyces sp. NPDC060232 TaxID=3347079 RepID=UPI00366550EA